MLLTTKEAADYLSMSAGTLENWRIQGKGPDYIKLGADGSRSLVRYRTCDLDDYVSASRVTPA